MGQVAPKVRKPGRAVRRSLRLLLAAARLPGVRRARRSRIASDAIYPATVVGKPRQEDFFIGDLLQDLLSPLFPLVMPAVEQLWSYGETGYHSLAGAVVKQRYKREAMASAFRILGEGQLSLTKFILLTDRLVDLKDFRATLEHVLARTNPQTDLYVFSNLSMDTLDYTGPVVNEGSKGVWLGLGDPIRELPRAFAPPVPPPSDVTDVRVYLRRLPGGRHAVVRRRPRGAVADRRASGLCRLAADRGQRRAGARDPQRHELPVDDVHALRAGGRHPLGIPARGAASHGLRAADRDRRAHEAVVSEGSDLRPDTAATVSRRWKEYFPAGNVAMGDSERGHLD